MHLSLVKSIRTTLKKQTTKQISPILVTLNHFVLVLILMSPVPVLADPIDEQIIKKLSIAYNVKALKSINAITISDYRKNVFTQQTSPESTPEYWRFNEELTIDFVNKKKALLSWRVNNTNKDLEKFIVDENSGRVYDILHGKYSDSIRYNYTNTGGAIERSSDTLIAKKLLSTNGSFKFIDEVQYQGQPHYHVTFAISGRTESHIFINKLSGVINKVSRIHPTLGILTYAFSNHSTVNNITYARDMNFSVGKTPRTISMYRNIELRPSLSDKFVVPERMSSWGVPILVANMTVNKFGENAYHVGKNTSRSLFIDAGEYFISAGGNAALKENFIQLQRHLNTTKPLKFAVLTHHHRRQLNMIEPALSLNAKIITVKSNLSAIQGKLNKELDENDIVLVDQSITLLEGNVEL